MIPKNIGKGSKIRAQWFQAKPLGTYSISGAQPKVVGDPVDVTGTVRHFRGDDPVNPTKIRVYIDSDVPTDIPTVRPFGCKCPNEHIEIDPAHIKEVVR